MTPKQLAVRLVQEGLTEAEASIRILWLYERVHEQAFVSASDLISFFDQHSISKPNKSRLARRIAADARVLADRRTGALRLRAAAIAELDAEMGYQAENIVLTKSPSSDTTRSNQASTSAETGTRAVVTCDVLISYTRSDKGIARQLCDLLESLGFRVWWDQDLETGDVFRSWIRHQIKATRSVVVLWSERSVESEFVADEAEYAKKLGLYCPVRIDRCDLPLGFGGRHTDDLSEWRGDVDHPGFARLLRTLLSRKSRKAA